MQNKIQRNSPNFLQNLVKISLKTPLRKIITYVLNLLKKPEIDFIVLSGLNKAIQRVIVVAEIIKVQVPNLHQINIIGHVEFQGKDGPSIIPKLEITLSSIEPKIKPYGYQPPITLDQAKLIKSCKSKSKKRSKANKVNNSFQLKRYSFFKKTCKIFLPGSGIVGKRKKKGTAFSSIDLKNSSSITTYGTPISSKNSSNKVFILKI